MTRTRYRLSDVPASLSWKDLRDFVNYLDVDSATWQECNEEWRGWGSRLHSENMLADIYNLLSAFRTQHANANSKRKERNFTPYPRPIKDKETRHMGSGAIEKGTFMDWWNSTIKGGER